MFTIVTLMPTVPTLKDLSTAAVIRDTLEMESRVLVCIIVFCILKWLLGSNLSRYAILYCWIALQRHQPGIWTEVNNKRPSPRHQCNFFICDIFEEMIYPLYGDSMLMSIRMGTNMAAGNHRHHLPLSFATKAENMKVTLFLEHWLSR